MSHHLDSIYVFYRLTSTLFDHHDLTTATGIKPWRAGNLGDRRNRNSRFSYRVSFWLQRARDPGIADLGQHLDELYRHLEPAWSTLRDYGTLYNASVWFHVGLRSNRPAPCFVLAPNHLQRIVDLHARLDIDPYCLGQDDLEPAPVPPIDDWRDAIELNTTTATYTLSGPNLDPARITALTRLIPSHTMHSSSPSTDSPGTTDANGEWQITVRRVMFDHGLDPIQALLDELLPARSILCDLGQEFTATVTIASRLHCSEGGVGMSFEA